MPPARPGSSRKWRGDACRSCLNCYAWDRVAGETPLLSPRLPTLAPHHVADLPPARQQITLDQMTIAALGVMVTGHIDHNEKQRTRGPGTRGGVAPAQHPGPGTAPATGPTAKLPKPIVSLPGRLAGTGRERAGQPGAQDSKARSRDPGARYAGLLRDRQAEKAAGCLKLRLQ